MSPGSKPTDPPGDQPTTVLVVDDEPKVRLFVRRTLEAVGYRVLEASYAEEALRLWNRCADEVDLVVTDVRMPGRTGCALANDLRVDRPEIAVLLISGCAQARLYDLGAELAGLPLLRKPFGVSHLREAVKDAMSH